MKKLFIFALLLLFCPALFAYDDPPSPEDIQKWEALAKQGNAEAQYNLGEAYSKGDGGLKEDKQEAFNWYERAANAGYMDAQMAMGFIYRGGEGIPMDKIMSYMWFEVASKKGNESAFNLRNNVAWSMTEPEIREARKRASEWKPSVYTDESD